MPKSRALGLSTALLLAGVPLSVVAVPGSASAAEATRMSAAFSHKVGVYKDAVPQSASPAPHVVTYKGRLQTAGGENIGGATVWLTRKLASDSVQKKIEKATTGPKGHVRFDTPVKGNAKYRIVFEGNVAHAESASTAMRLKAMRDFNARMVEKGSGADKRVFLRGDINPGWNNKRVSWQRKKCGSCSWRTIDTKKSGGAGAWSFRAGFPTVGKSWKFRAKIVGTDTFVASTSAVLTTQTRYGRGTTSHAFLDEASSD
jgi:hypothetical protein